MPFLSKSQRRKFYALKSEGKMTQNKIDEWEQDTPKNIPERISKVAMKSFFNGFEKQSVLADLPMYAGRAGKKLLNKMTSKLTAQRVKNTPNASVSSERVRDLFKRVRKGDGTAAMHMSTLPGSTVPGAGGKTNIHVLPEKSHFNKLLYLSKKTRPAGQAMRNPQARSGIVHHELDEMESMARRGISPNDAKMTYKPKVDLNPTVTRFKERMYEAGKEGKNKFIAAVAGAKEAYPDIKRAISTAKAHPQTAMHAGPEVLINESNRAFHAMGPEARASMKQMRKGNEGELLKRHGLRYGDEYIQPGTRRYSKLVKNVENNVTQSGGDSVKLFPKKQQALDSAKSRILANREKKRGQT